MLIHIDSLPFTGLICESFRQNLVQIAQLQVLVHPQVESESGGEVTESHEIADWLHDIPGVPFESANEDESELSDADCTASPEEGLGLTCRTLSIGLDLSFSLCDLLEKLLFTNQHLAMILSTS